MRKFLFLLLVPLLAIAQQPDSGTGQETISPEPVKSPEASNSPNPQSPSAAKESQPQDSDFKPSEEISEDFPVPLPSDI